MKFSKKTVTFFAVLVLVIFNSFAGGIGFSAASDVGTDFSFGSEINFKPDTLPFVFCGNAMYSSKEFKSLSFEVDYWAFNMNLYKALNSHFGPELKLGYDFCKEMVLVQNGFFFGLNAFFVPHLEFYGQASWSPKFMAGSSQTEWNLVNFPVKLGLRVWNK